MKTKLKEKISSFFGIQIIVAFLAILFCIFSFILPSLSIIFNLLLVISFSLISYISPKQNPKKITYLYYVVTVFCIIRLIMDVIQYG